MTGNRPLWDELFEGFDNAVADVRNTVVEESWFGRPVTTHEPGLEAGTDEHGAAHQPEITEPNSDIER